MDQFESAMEQDFSVKGALMADAHTGYSLPIGGVIATRDVILPSWVGYDIGCGMCAVPTTFSPKQIQKKAKNIFEEIYKRVPVGFAVHKKSQKSHLSEADLSEIGREVFKKKEGFRALGTLGSGNHFIEIGEDTENTTWVIIHSGSRGVGHGLATAYMKLASGDGKAREGHFGFEESSELGQSYMNDLNWGLEFALENRKQMMANIEKAIHEFISDGSFEWEQLINRNHNHAEKKEGLWIHRKGATHAEKGMMGVIPGNMRDGSFIVKGKGNPDSLWSSSHGAGRVLGRKAAQRSLSLNEFQKAMKGITAKVSGKTIDESPFAYKNIFEVIGLQEDLIEVVTMVKPIVNIKG